jgi:hypothetical protein
VRRCSGLLIERRQSDHFGLVRPYPGHQERFGIDVRLSDPRAEVKVSLGRGTVPLAGKRDSVTLEDARPSYRQNRG